PSDAERELPPELRTYEKHWIPWVRGQFAARGIPTVTPAMPDPWAPDYATFKQAFEQHPVSERTILVGHSCGCAFLVRWLGDTKREIDTLALVAPWKVARAGDIVRAAFYDYVIDVTIRSRVRRILMFTSDTEHEDGKRSLEIYRTALGGKIIDLPNRGHY